MIPRRLLLSAVVLGALTPGAWAQDLIQGEKEKKGDTKQAATKKVLEKAQEEYRTLFKEPKTALEYWAALSFEVQVGKFDVAAYHLDKLLSQPEKERDDDLLKIEDVEGLNTFLRLREVNEWSKQEELNKEAKQNVEKLINTVLAAVEKKLSDQQRIAKYIKGMIEPEPDIPEVRAFSLIQVKRSGYFAAPLLAEALRNTSGQKLNRLKRYLLELNRDILPPMLELLRARDVQDAADIDFRVNLLWLFKERQEKRAIPYLWNLSASPKYPAVLRERAKDTLAYFLGTEADRLVPAKVALTQLAENYYQYKVRLPDTSEVAELDNPAKMLVMPGYKLWPLDDKGSITEKWETLKPDQARMGFGIRYASQALELDKGYLPAQIVYLALRLEEQFQARPYDGQLDKLLTETRPAALQQLLGKIDIELLSSVLERAMAEHNYAVILPLVDALGERGEVRSALATSTGAPGLLIKALYYPDSRVQYAAARAMLRLPSSPAPVASARIVDILGRFLRTTPAPKVLFVYAKDQRATELRKAAKDAMYEAEFAANAKDALKLLHKSADYNAIVLDAGVPDAELPFALTELRADSDAGLLPLLVVATDNKKADLTLAAERFKNTFILPSFFVAKGEDFKRELDDAIKFAAAPESVRKAPADMQPWLRYTVRRAKGQPLSEAERQRFAGDALGWFALMASGELTGYDLKPAQDALLAAVINKERAAQALRVLARFPGSEMQQWLAGVLFDAEKQPLHAIAAKELNRHIQKHGLVLTKDQVGRLRDMEQRMDIAPEVRVELAILVGTMRGTAQQTGSRLLGYSLEQPEKK
jgi:CheY-like chemotaxis protein